MRNNKVMKPVLYSGLVYLLHAEVLCVFFNAFFSKHIIMRNCGIPFLCSYLLNMQMYSQCPAGSFPVSPHWTVPALHLRVQNQRLCCQFGEGKTDSPWRRKYLIVMMCTYFFRIFFLFLSVGEKQAVAAAVPCERVCHEPAGQGIVKGIIPLGGWHWPWPSRVATKDFLFDI